MKKNPFSQLFEWVFESRVGGVVINLILLPILCMCALLLPPISLPYRIMAYDYDQIGRGGGSISDPDGTQVTFLPEGIERSFQVKMNAIPRSIFLEGSASDGSLLKAAESIPPNLVMKSPFYNIDLWGDMPTDLIVTVPIPNEAEPYGTLDLYSWNGETGNWEWVPNRKIIQEDRIEAELEYLPDSVVVMQTHAVHPNVSTNYSPDHTLLEGIENSLVEINPQGLYLESEGKIVGEVPTLPAELENISLNILPTVRNWADESAVRSDLADNLLIDPAAREKHIQTLVGLVEGYNYQGIDLDYRGISPDLKNEYTSFLEQLRDALPANKQLSVRVELPQQVSEDQWETGAYDWRAIGRIADTVKLPTSPNPKAYAPGAEMDKMLDWAVGNINRYKLQLLLNTHSTEQTEGVTRDVPYDKALEPLGNATLIGGVAGENVVLPGQPLGFTLAGVQASTGVQFDSPSGTYWYAYIDSNDNQHTVYLENAASIARKLQFVAQYHLRGVAVKDLLNKNNDTRILEVVQKFLELVIPPVESNYSVVWRIKNGDDGVIAEEVVNLRDPNYNWTAPEVEDTYSIEAAISSSQDSSVAVPRGTVVVLIATLTPTPTPTPAPTDTPTPEPPTPTPTPTDTPTPEPVVEEEPAQLAEAPAEQPAAAPAAAPAPGIGNVPFGYGIQADPRGNTAANIGHLHTLGFNWVKFQMAWKDVEPGQGGYSWGMWDEIINAYNANGIQVMLSIPKAPDWARPPGDDRSVEGPPQDPALYAQFVAHVAARYPGRVQAIEVWNEQNLWYEAGGRGRINAGTYTNLLQLSYNAIKSVNPDMIVMSGALTPAGNVGDLATDDIDYLNQMYANGAKGHFDVLGAHPSGFLCPAMGQWTTVTPEEAVGDPGHGTFTNRHHSWCFLGTMEGYRNVMVANGDSAKSISPTEFGWAVTGNPQPGYEYARDNSPEEQARWIVESYQWGKQAGWVGPMFLWNLDYGVTAASTELANFGIIGKPAYNSLAGMPK
ncbi:glycosyl hydrolase family 18 protein [Anaerolineales bacterium HSG6]|nr:glycosyl hydrolase family 18 protein [Anaerolineales bacterium HSG6]